MGWIKTAWFILAMTFAAPAAAQLTSDAPPPVSADERAKELYLRGDRLYAEGEYEDAVKAFVEAHELSGRPELLYNIANALERLGRYEQALERLNAYAPHAPEHQRHTVMKRIHALEKRAEEQRTKESEAESQAQSQQNQAPKAAPPASKSATPRNESSGDSGSATKTSAPIAAYALLGTGALSLGLGTYFGLNAAKRHSDAESACVDSGSSKLCSVDAQAALNDEKSSALIADIGFGVGLVALAVRVYLVIDSGNADHDRGRVSLQTSATLTGGSMNLVTRF